MKNSGITLISLVITIIVLIIVAGVTINLTIGENGILDKAQQAKENYMLAANEEMTEMADLEQQIENNRYGQNNDNNNAGVTVVDSGEYFLNSLNGYTRTLGTGTLNSLFGLSPSTYEAVEGDVWQHCRYEKELDSVFDMSGEFEISFKSRLETTSSNQMGGIRITFQKLNAENVYEDVLSFHIQDSWGSVTQIYTAVVYKEETLITKNESISKKYETIGFIGDGENVKLYCDDTLLATTTQKDLSFDKIVIDFQYYPSYSEVYKNYLERLYYGDVKYYSDII